MTPRTCLGAIVALLLGLTAAAAQEPIETRGAWRIVADGSDFALRTQALDAPGTTLSLLCYRDSRVFSFEVKSPALAARQSGDDIRIGFKVDGEDQIWFNLSTGANGTIPITHPTPFWSIHEAVMRAGAKAITFTAGDHGWQFPLDGLASLTESLTRACGFEASRPPPPSRSSRP